MKDARSLPGLNASKENWEERRKEIRTLLTDLMYGKVTNEYTVSHKMCEESDRQTYTVTVNGAYGTHDFSFDLFLPETGAGPHPVILYLGWKRNPDSKWGAFGEMGMPPAFLKERGYALAICHFMDMETDDPSEFPCGLARVLEGERRPDSIGALGTWALGMQMILRILEKREDIDASRMAVAGCSRLGKAALWCGASDESVYLTASFDSGCGGAAINRGKQFEQISDMMKNFPHWMCGNIEAYRDKDEEIPFDQHFLLSLIAPRKLLVTSSTRDPYSDPYAEFLGLCYAEEAYRIYDKQGIDTWIWPPAETTLLGDGTAYYLREGNHGVEDSDWQALLTLMEA